MSAQTDASSAGTLSLVLRHQAAATADPESPAAHRLYRLIAETTLPLIESLASSPGGPITLVVSPTLAEMWAQPALRARCAEALGERVVAAERAAHAAPDRTSRDAAEHRAAAEGRAARLYDTLEGDLADGLSQLAEAGRVHLATTPATDAILPLLGDRARARPQIAAAVAAHTRHFGAAPTGIDLTRGYIPRVDLLLAEHGLRWCLVGAVSFDRASARPVMGTWAPLHCPRSGVAAFAVDPRAHLLDAAAERATSARDRGLLSAPPDLRLDRHPEHAPPGPPRALHGGPYQPDVARADAVALGQAWWRSQEARLKAASAALGQPAHAVALLDAALFGRWWAEGPAALAAMSRAAGERMIDPTGALDPEIPRQAAWPGLGRHGKDGDFAALVSGKRGWIVGALAEAADAMVGLADRFESANPRVRGVASRAARALLLAQSGDDVLMLDDAHAPEALARLRAHLDEFATLRADLLDDDGPHAAAEAPGLFAGLDVRPFASW